MLPTFFWGVWAERLMSIIGYTVQVQLMSLAKTLKDGTGTAWHIFGEILGC